MPKIGEVQFPQGFNEAQVTHLQRSAEVIILKKIKNFVEPGSSDLNTEYWYFSVDFAEFLTGKRKLLKSSKVLDTKWFDPDDTDEALYRHYFVTATSEQKAGTTANINDVTPAESNSDVLSVSAMTTTEGRGRCTIVLNGREKKYQFQDNAFRLDDPVFEQNDQVFVALSGLDGVMRRVFTGYITTINVQTVLQGTIQTVITLECEDTLKPLAQSRTNLRPSLNCSEAGGNRFHALNPTFADQLPHEIVSHVMARAYADLYTAQGFRGKIDDIRKAAKGEDSSTRAIKAQEENDEVDKYTKLGASGTAQFPFLFAEDPQEISVDPIGGGEVLKLSKRAVTIPKRIYGFKRVRSLTQARSVFDLALSATAPNHTSDVDEIAFIIDGTIQPAYKLSYTGQTSLFVSEWKSSLELIQTIAANINYEFFMDPSGIVIFRPMNITLPFDFANGANRVPTSATVPGIGDKGRVGSEYWLETKYISGQDYTETDSGVFTIAYVLGDHQLWDAAGLQIYRGVAVDVSKFLRLGARMAPAVQRLNLLSSDACAAYAKLYLSRLNANASTATIQYMGDSRLRPGNPCYVPHRNRVYYITAVQHDFVAGGTYTTTLSIKYGRRPIASTSATGVRSLRYVLGRRDDIDDVDVIAREVKKNLTSESDYIRNNEKHLTFNGYVWEPIYSLTYESLGEAIRKTTDEAYRKIVTEGYQLESRTFLTQLQKVMQGEGGESPDENLSREAGLQLLKIQ